MAWIGDLHIHSHFSMATSKDCNPVNLHRWAGLKGVSLVGTGDFTHPGWRKELRENLEEAEPGFYRLKNTPGQEIPNQPEVRFIVSGELSAIYKKNGRTRKVHHLLLLPSLEAADRISDKLENLGMNIRSDGRPILGLDSYYLLQMALDLCPEVIFIPAHIWTPHFSVFGSNSGFDDFTECFEDLSGTIYALETGLSADPEMIWQWSALDRFTLVSNSDAHNPQNLVREANLFEADFSYQGLQNALRKKGDDRLVGTIEFFPEEGKYHYDGHRHCQIALEPSETRRYQGLCPKCGKKVTVGVLNRVTLLADRPLGFRPEGGQPFERMVPLRQVIGDAFGVGAASRKAESIYFNLLHQFGPELSILRTVAIKELMDYGGPLLGTAIQRLRDGQVDVKPGYDGEYGVISIINADERRTLQGQSALFENVALSKQRRKVKREEAAAVESVSQLIKADSDQTGYHPSDEQLEIISSTARVIKVVAGPGTGKTRTLVEKIAYLLQEQGVAPEEITAVTFTNKAAAEIRERLERHPKLQAQRIRGLNVGTFHSLAWKVLKSGPHQAVKQLLDASEAKEIIKGLIKKISPKINPKDALLFISRMKNGLSKDESSSSLAEMNCLYENYQKSLQLFERWDFDDLILQTIKLWDESPAWLDPFKKNFNYVLVDEFQDVNPAQYRLVKLWAKDSKGLMVIGDPNQSIYGFRGSSSIFFEELEKDFPETVSYKLTGNYRSSAVIVETANHLIPERYRQLTSTSRPEETGRIQWFETDSAKMEARVVTQEIVHLMGGSTMLTAHGQVGKAKYTHRQDNSFSLSDFAILFRTGYQADAFEDALANAGLPYRVVGQTEVLEEAPVREFLAFFRFVQQPDDLFLLRMALNQPRWGLDIEAIDRCLRLIADKPQVIIESQLDYLLLAISDNELRNKLRRFREEVRAFQNILDKPSSEIINRWMAQSGLQEQLELGRLVKLSETYQSLADLLRFLPLATDADLTRYGTNSNGLECITLSTIHAAKGLEYPVVFIAGVEEGLLPFGKDPDITAVAEEQRLFYVGVTRAQHCLYFVNSRFRFRNGENGPVDSSRFLKKFPSDLLEKKEWQRASNHQKQLELF